ncbi:MAG: endonuclease III [Marinagarivorans sp.]
MSASQNRSSSAANSAKQPTPTKRQRAALVLAQLQARYPNPPIPLKHTDAFTLLIAVLLSAQCTDERVNQVTPALFALANTPAAMAQQSVDAIAAIIRPCGLSPQKSKAIKRLSELLLEHHQGQVPKDFKALEALPGVGHKTASVVMSQAFGVPAFAVDTHIHRLAQRWGLTSGKNVVQTEADLKALFPQEHWNHLHLQFIYWGREYCSARGCDGTVCTLCRACYPNRRKPKTTLKA